MLRFATRGGRFGDVAVRRAVELAVDRQAIVDALLAGRSRVPRGYLVPPLWAASVTGPVPRPDREAARAPLAQAGFGTGSFGILERAGQRMVVPPLVAPGPPVRPDAARVLAGTRGDRHRGGSASCRSRAPATLRRGDWDLALLPEGRRPAGGDDRWLGLTDPWFDVLVGRHGRLDRAAQRPPGPRRSGSGD